MKREKAINCFIGALLAFLLAFGTVGSMVTGLNLPVSGMGRLAFACAAVSGISALCFGFRFGGAVLLCLLAVLAGLILRDGNGAEQVLAVVYRMTYLYNNAYGWGIPRFAAACRSVAPVDMAMVIVGGFVAVLVSWCVCWRQLSVLGLLSAILPLFTCFVVTDTVPDSIYLYIWLLGASVLLLTGNVRHRNLLQSIPLTAMAAVAASLALALLFWAVPREGYDKHPEELQAKVAAWVQQLPDFWEELRQDGADTGSTTSQLNLRATGPKQQQNSPVMDVKATEGGTLYLRGQDYNTYDGTRWTSSRRREESFPENRFGEDAGEVTIRTRRIRDVIYLPYYPAESVSLTGGQLRNGDNRKEYTLSRTRLPDNWRQQIAETESTLEGVYFAFAAYPETYQTSERYLVLPKDTQVWAQELLENLLTGEKTATAVADTIGAYVRNSARYDLNTARMPSGEEDFARWFLVESETGYCVHFATAATVLLRAAGVEARYVEGYMVSAAANQQVTVKAYQAHAWAEYYEPLLDTWIVLEATPADGLPENAVQPTQQTAATEREETVPSESENPKQAEAALSGPQATQPENGAAARPPVADWMALLKWVCGVAVLTAAVPGQRLLRLRLRRQRQNRGGANARGLRRWREIVYLHRILRESPPPALEELAQKAKFSQHSLTAEELAALEDGIHAARQRLRARSRVCKFIDKYIFAAY